MNRTRTRVPRNQVPRDSPLIHKNPNTFQIFCKNHSELIFGIGLSTILLIVFFRLEAKDSHILLLDWKWIVVSAIPLIVALIIGGYIKSFKGFGVEFEATLKEQLSFIDLPATGALSSIGQIEKGTMSDLDKMDNVARDKVNRLRFILGKRDYYNRDVIEEYLQRLHHLEYLEITDSNGMLVCLIPASIMLFGEDVLYEKIQPFINALQDRTITGVYDRDTINNYIYADTNIIEALATMRETNQEIAAVVNSKRIAVGVITLSDIEHHVATAVLNQARAKGLK